MNFLKSIGRAISNWINPPKQVTTSKSTPKPTPVPTPAPKSIPASSYKPTNAQGVPYAGYRVPASSSRPTNSQGQSYAGTPQNFTSGGGGGGSSSSGGGGQSYSSPSYSTPQQSYTPYVAPKFDAGALQRKLQSEMSAAGKGLSQGVSNITGGIGRFLSGNAGKAYSAEIGGMKEDKKKNMLGNILNQANTNAKSAHAGSWRGLPDLGITEKIGSMLGSPLSSEQGSNVIPTWGKLLPVENPNANMADLPSNLPSTPGEALGASTGGGGFRVNTTNPEAGDLVSQIFQELMSAPEQISQMPTVDLEAETQRIMQEYGIPQQQAAVKVANEQAMKVADLIENLDADITELGKGSLMTEGQRRAMVASKGAPLRQQLAQLLRAAQYAGVGLNEAMQLVSQRIEAKKSTVTSQFQAAQLAQQAEEQRKNRLLQLLPYMQPTAAQTLSAKKGASSSSGGDSLEAWLNSAQG